nr:MAG TPA: hypothetical protein [Caudoviricetes sp.]
MKNDSLTSKESMFQIYWSKFKSSRDNKNRLLPRYVRRAKLKTFVKGL